LRNPGDRVFAIRNATQEEVFAFGYGVYEGDEVPPVGTIGALGIDLGEVKMPNPKITLDNGTVVWGCQCWWGSEAGAPTYIAGRKVTIVEP
jgi:hypothetical protein